jgi:hypothetical protein
MPLLDGVITFTLLCVHLFLLRMAMHVVVIDNDVPLQRRMRHHFRYYAECMRHIITLA